jgi:hypothetical protein
MANELVRKELRECAGIGALGLVALLVVAQASIGWSPVPWLSGPVYQQGQIPFVSDAFPSRFGVVACVLAVALGFKQSLGDFFGDAQLFLFHRPISRRRMFGIKLSVGVAVYLALAALPIVIYALWAAREGTHASPFYWSMTLDVWTSWLAMSAVYLAAFLSGIRPAAWFGSRLAPLAGSGALLTIAAVMLPTAVAWLVLLIADILLAALILHVADSRDLV